MDGEAVQLVERLRPTFTKRFSDRLALSATIEAGLNQGRDLQEEFEHTVNDSALGPILRAAGFKWPEAKNETLEVSTSSDYLKVDRLYLDAYLKAVDLRLGRQAINWGSAMVVNPTDPFPQVLATQPWLPRAGVNALRATYALGEKKELQAVVGTDDTFTHARLASRATVNTGLTDLSLVGAWRGDARSGILGLDVRGTLEVGYWLEGSVHLGSRGTERSTPYEEVAVGGDYSFPVLEKLVVSAQYYRNGGGRANATGAGAASGSQGLRWPTCSGSCGNVKLPKASDDPFAPFFHGRDYAMASAALTASPELSFSALWIQNLGDGSGLAVPTATYAPTGWFEVSLAAQIPFLLWGEGGELHPSRRQLTLQVDTGEGTVQVDLSGLAPAAVISLWTRFSF